MPIVYAIPGGGPIRALTTEPHSELDGLAAVGLLERVKLPDDDPFWLAILHGDNRNGYRVNAGTLVRIPGGRIVNTQTGTRKPSARKPSAPKPRSPRKLSDAEFLDYTAIMNEKDIRGMNRKDLHGIYYPGVWHGTWTRSTRDLEELARGAVW